MKIVTLTSYHSAEVREHVEKAWYGEHLLLLVPPAWKDVDNLEEEIRSQVYPEPPVFGIFTSGTLGRKLILYSRRNIEASLEGIFSFFDVSRIQSVFCYPQAFHVFGLTLGYLFSHLYQKDLICPEGAYSRAAHELWWDNVTEGTLTLGTPTHLQDLLAFSGDRVPPASYSAIIGGAPVTRDLWLEVQTKLGIQYPSIGYGASELSPGATHLPPGWTPREDNEIGFPLPNLELNVYPGRGIQVRGENTCLALYQNGQFHFPTEVWLRDEVRKREDGVFVFDSRTDLTLNRGGEKYSFEAIERLLWCELRLEAIAVPVPDLRLGEELGLVIKGEDNDVSSAPLAYKTLKNTFGRDFDPRYCVPTRNFPLGESSKIDRMACRRLVEARLESH